VRCRRTQPRLKPDLLPPLRLLRSKRRSTDGGLRGIRMPGPLRSWTMPHGGRWPSAHARRGTAAAGLSRWSVINRCHRSSCARNTTAISAAHRAGTAGFRLIRSAAPNRAQRGAQGRQPHSCCGAANDAMAAPAYMKGLGRALRRIGQGMDRFGLALQEKEGYVERRTCSNAVAGCSVLRVIAQLATACMARACTQAASANAHCVRPLTRPAAASRACHRAAVVPSTRVVPFKGKEFTYGLQNFVASTASVVGDVAFGELSSAWYGATVRGECAACTGPRC
jgi:hypothetical protein